jgi:hypothetical protein
VTPAGFEPGLGGPERSTDFVPLWWQRPGDGAAAILRALAALGAMLVLGGLLARRMTGPRLAG